MADKLRPEAHRSRLPTVLRGLAAALLLCAGLAAAQAPLKLVSGKDYPPFSDPALPGGGLATQRVVAAFQAVGMTVDIAWLPWARGYHATLAGEYAATFPYIPTEAREKAFLYSAPLFRVPIYVYGRPGDPRVAMPVARLAKARLCLPAGWAGPRDVERLLANHDVVPERPRDLSACARMILLDRADYMVADEAAAEAALAQAGLGPDALARGPESVGVHTLHLIVPRRYPDAALLIRQFDEGLRRLPPPPAPAGPRKQAAPQP